MEETIAFAQALTSGNAQITATDTLAKSGLGKALISIQQHVSKLSEEEKQRTWLNEGLATFSDILRNKESLELQELSDQILTKLVRYIDANQGAIFSLEEEDGGETHLQLLSCYAYDRKKYRDKKIGISEGLAGQAVLEKEAIYLKQVPQNYVKITSGLGEAPPREIFISPLIVNEKVFGVIEFAFFRKVEEHKLQFLKKLSESIAGCIKNVKETTKVRALLLSSQQQAEELRAQEEEMRQNMEELQATQEEMERKGKEVSRVAAEMKGVLNGINATMATIEFTPDGTILTANDNFLKAIRYNLPQIQNKHHKLFVPEDILHSKDYSSFWARLAAGEALTGVFKRKTSDGSIIWLNAIYSPIQNADGHVTRVVKFATDISQEQHLNALSRGILTGIDATMATAEFSPQGSILNANENFLRLMLYSIIEIKGKHHKLFLDDESANSEEYKNFWNRLARGEAITGKFKRRARDGKTVWLSAIYNPILDGNGNVLKIIKFANDITAQEELAAEAKGVMEGISASMGTIEFAPDGTILTANENFLSSVEYDLEDVVGRHHRIFVPKELHETAEYKTFWHQLAYGMPHSGRFQRICSSGRVVWITAIYHPVRNAEGKVKKIVKFATDVSAIKKVSEKRD